jgi:hypothetical protein
MSNSAGVSSEDLVVVAGVFRAVAEARSTFFSKVYAHAILRWPDVKSTVTLDLCTNKLETASTLHLALSVPRPDGTEVAWRLDLWIGPEVVSATGVVYATTSKRLVVDTHFECTEEATGAAGAAELIRSMAARVCAERRLLES